MANHGARVRRIVDRHGIDKVEEFIDICLSLENLIDPWSPFIGAAARRGDDEDEPPRDRGAAAPRQGLHGGVHQPRGVPRGAEEEDRGQARRRRRASIPASRERDVLVFLSSTRRSSAGSATSSSIVREEAYYFVPQMQTKIMNEGWATYWHSQHDDRATSRDCERDHRLRRQQRGRHGDQRRAAQSRTSSASSSTATSRSAGTRASSAASGRSATTSTTKKNWDLRLGLGREKIFEVRALYNDVTFIDEFLTPEFAIEHKLFTFGWSSRNDRFEIESREFKEVKEKLLFQLTNFGNPFIYVEDANYENRGELLLRHEHRGVDLRPDYARETLTRWCASGSGRCASPRCRRQNACCSATTARSTPSATTRHDAC